MRGRRLDGRGFIPDPSGGLYSWAEDTDHSRVQNKYVFTMDTTQSACQHWFTNCKPMPDAPVIHVFAREFGRGFYPFKWDLLTLHLTMESNDIVETQPPASLVTRERGG